MIRVRFVVEAPDCFRGGTEQHGELPDYHRRSPGYALAISRNRASWMPFIKKGAEAHGMSLVKLSGMQAQGYPRKFGIMIHKCKDDRPQNRRRVN